MIWDEWLAGPIGLIAKYGLIQDHDVTEMLRLQKNLTIPSNVKHVIFIIRAKIELIDLIADNVLRVSKSSIEPKKEFHIFFVPRKSELCEKHLSNKRVFGSFTIEEFKCDIYPFESDLISLEFQNDFRLVIIYLLYIFSQSVYTIITVILVIIIWTVTQLAYTRQPLPLNAWKKYMGQFLKLSVLVSVLNKFGI